MDSPTAIENQTPKEKPIVITSEGSKKPQFKFSFVNPKILAAMTILLLLIGGVGTGVYLIQKPQQTTTQANLTPVDLIFQPSQIRTERGTEFNADIYVNSNNNQITGTDLHIKYDPTVLTLKSIAPGQFLPKIIIPPVISEGSASISLGTDGNSGVAGNGVVATLLFEAKSESSEPASEITFDPTGTKINVLNRSDENNSDSLGKAQITINTASTPQTPSPNPSPSTPPAQAESLDSSDSGSNSSGSSQITDFNGDGQTNSIDLSVMYSGWGTPETAVQKKADLNSDGKINGIDYSIFLPKFRL